MIIKRHKKIRNSWDDKIFDIVCNLFLIGFVLIVFYPIYYIVIASISDPVYAYTGKPLLYPKGITMEGIKLMLQEERLWKGYANTIYYTFCGTLLGVTLCILAGYAFSRKDLPGRNILMKLYVFTMYFGGGMIPTFIVVKNLHMVNTRWAMIILGCVSVYNIIIVRSTMESTIPNELLDAARIDGCGNCKFFVKIVIPLSKAIIAVMVLYMAVGYWNSYMNAVLYISDENMYPLQLQLRQILYQVNESLQEDNLQASEDLLNDMFNNLKRVQLIKYGAIVVSTAPVICIYPFIQKYFIKGVMIGSIKG